MTLDKLRDAVSKARGDINSDDDMQQNIDFLNRAAEKLKEWPLHICPCGTRYYCAEPKVELCLCHPVCPVCFERNTPRTKEQQS